MSTGRETPAVRRKFLASSLALFASGCEIVDQKSGVIALNDITIGAPAAVLQNVFSTEFDENQSQLLKIKSGTQIRILIGDKFISKVEDYGNSGTLITTRILKSKNGSISLIDSVSTDSGNRLLSADDAREIAADWCRVASGQMSITADDGVKHSQGATDAEVIICEGHSNDPNVDYQVRIIQSPLAPAKNRYRVLIYLHSINFSKGHISDLQ